MHDHYHETFWLIAGTAAPVIALALVVAIGDLSRAGQHIGDLSRATDRTWRRTSLEWRKYRIYTTCIWVEMLDFLAMTGVLALSLYSVVTGQDQGSLPVAGWVLACGLLAVLLAQAGTVVVRFGPGGGGPKPPRGWTPWWFRREDRDGDAPAHEGDG
jgi:hypothetical protein